MSLKGVIGVLFDGNSIVKEPLVLSPTSGNYYPLFYFIAGLSEHSGYIQELCGGVIYIHFTRLNCVHIMKSICIDHVFET
jgi:hypothetical protein